MGCSIKISVVIPVYNVEPYISDCIRSVMDQTFLGSIECVIVDDCGTDNSILIAKKMIEEYCGSIVFRIVHHDRNRGLSAARNTGIKESTGDYIFFLDSDDWISNNCLESLCKPLEVEEYDLVVGDYDQTSSLYSHIPLCAEEGAHYSTGDIFDIICNKGIYVMAVNKLYKKSFLTQNDLLFEYGKINEDEILAFDVSCTLKSAYVVKDITYHYRIRDDSIIGTSLRNDKKRIEACFGVLNVIKERCRGRFRNLNGIFDFYMFWVGRVFRWLSHIEQNIENVSLIQKESLGFLRVIPGLCYLSNKHNRLTYFICRNDQTYLKYRFATETFNKSLPGRVMRNCLNLLPDKR